MGDPTLGTNLGSRILAMQTGCSCQTKAADDSLDCRWRFLSTGCFVSIRSLGLQTRHQPDAVGLHDCFELVLLVLVFLPGNKGYALHIHPIRDSIPRIIFRDGFNFVS